MKLRLILACVLLGVSIACIDVGDLNENGKADEPEDYIIYCTQNPGADLCQQTPGGDGNGGGGGCGDCTEHTNENGTIR